jgi:Flp pilus assembly protein TadD
MPTGSSAPTLDDAIAVHQAGRAAEAERIYRQILEREPNNVDCLHRLGVVLFQRGERAQAIHHLDLALAQRPNDTTLHNNRGVMLKNMQRFGEALASYDQAIALKPDNADAFNNRGVALAELNRFAEALASYDQAIALNPAFAEPHNNRGNVLRELRRFDDAQASYAQALAIAPNFVEAHFNDACCRLLHGDFATGFEAYEARWETRKLRAARRNFAQPRWGEGDELAGKTILLHAEQGFGDTIQFGRYVPLVAGRGGRVILEVQPQLKRLLSGLAGTERVVTQGETLPDFDLHSPLLSLPRVFATRLETIPAPCPLPPVPPALVKEWEAKLGPRRRPRVGIAWSGSAAHQNDRNRSIPLRQMLALAALPVDLVSMQPELDAQDAAVLTASNAHLTHFGTACRFPGNRGPGVADGYGRCGRYRGRASRRRARSCDLDPLAVCPAGWGSADAGRVTRHAATSRWN